jgi:acyl-CoA synthetase (AMP-forming)/AMP-acid ligase II
MTSQPTPAAAPLPATLASGVRSFPHMLLEAARLYADAPAVVAEDGTVTSYRQLAAQVARAARAFLALGVEPGDRVAVWAPNSPEWIVAALGAQWVGAALVPLNTRLKAAEASYILRAAQARLLFTVAGFLGVDYPAALAGEQTPALQRIITVAGRSTAPALDWADFLAAGDAVAEAAALARLDALTQDDTSDIIFTSGTTGRPKGVMTGHGQNLRQYAAYSGELGLGPDDRYLIVNPFFHTFGYKAGWLIALMRGAALYPIAMFDTTAVLERIAAEKITYLPGPPTIFQSLLAGPYGDYDLSSLRLSITGAATIPVQLVERMRSDLQIDRVLTAYGLTESCGVVTMCSRDDPPETVALTVGRPIPGVELRILDEAGQDAPEDAPGGAIGEICVRGDCVMQGYLDEPAETEKAIGPGGWLHTGDLGRIGEDGCLRITGRKKEMFIVGGFNCYPAEIENEILAHPDVAEVAVVGVPDERMGEVGKAVVVIRPGAALTPAELIAWCRTRMANYKAPRQVEIIEALPKNAAGKVEKFRLVAPPPAGAPNG